ncbi:MAG: hypothetical protein R3313_02720 [Candidatus Saccharimonadales bacterium]|nr:hypothetical protein [Candidatus Saccharimonadales bacterium]
MDDIRKPRSGAQQRKPKKQDPEEQRGIDLDRPKHFHLARKHRRNRRLKKLGIFVILLFLLGWLPFRFYFGSLERVKQFYQDNYDNGSSVLKTITTTNNTYYEDGLEANEIGPILESLDSANEDLKTFSPSQPSGFTVNFATENIDGAKEALEKLQDDDMAAVWNNMQFALQNYLDLLWLSGSIENFNVTEDDVSQLRNQIEDGLQIIESSESLDTNVTESTERLLRALVAEIEEFEVSQNQVQLAIAVINVGGELVKQMEVLWQSVINTNLSEFSELVSDNEYMLNLLVKE